MLSPQYQKLVRRTQNEVTVKQYFISLIDCHPVCTFTKVNDVSLGSLQNVTSWGGVSKCNFFKSCVSLSLLSQLSLLSLYDESLSQKYFDFLFNLSLIGFTPFSDTVIDNIITEWQITKYMEIINMNSSRTTSVKTLSNKIRKIMEHEEKVGSKGKETEYIRQDDKSEEIGRKYRIMQVLQLEKARLTGREHAPFASRSQTSEMCQNLTAAFAKPDCSNCKPSDPYRTIDGCCNNLNSPTLGILVEIQTNIHPPSFPFLGMPQTAFLRLRPPAYSKGSLPRGGLTSSSLPSARAVSVAVHQAHKETNHRESISQMVMQFGQEGQSSILSFLHFHFMCWLI